MTKEKTGYNMGFAIAGLMCFVDTVVLDQTVSLRRNCSANHPRHRKPLKRYMPFCTTAMKQTIYILTLAFGLWSCNNPTTEKTSDKNSADTLQTVSADKHQDIYIKDKSQYDPTFINGLADYNEAIKLIDNYIITGKDTTYFPTDLSLNKATTFIGTKDNSKFMLTVTRTNLTNLTYNFQLTDKDNKTVDNKSGKAVLSSTFFLGPEGDDDIETQSGYGSQEYSDNSRDSWLSIRIEIGKSNEGKQRAKIEYGYSDKTKQSLNLDACPTLRTE